MEKALALFKKAPPALLGANTNLFKVVLDTPPSKTEWTPNVERLLSSSTCEVAVKVCPNEFAACRIPIARCSVINFDWKFS